MRINSTQPNYQANNKNQSTSFGTKFILDRRYTKGLSELMKAEPDTFKRIQQGIAAHNADPLMNPDGEICAKAKVIFENGYLRFIPNSYKKAEMKLGVSTNSFPNSSLRSDPKRFFEHAQLSLKEVISKDLNTEINESTRKFIFNK